MELQEKSIKIKELAKSLGFSACGIVSARKLEEDALHLEKWLQKGFAASMKYMHENFDKRVDPQLLVEGTKSIVVLTYNYAPSEFLFENRKYKISRYALGRDYHKVLKSKLKLLFSKISHEIEPIEGRFFVDSAPVLERAWAREAGLGWIGKNSLLLNKDQGSYFFLSVLLLNIEMSYDLPINEFCGNCNRCIESCPTQAIVAPKVVDAGKCISYHTIESHETMPENIRKMQHSWIFGCDICQEVCPWNQRFKPHHEPDFLIRQELEQMTDEQWENLKEFDFEKIAVGSSLKRAGFKKMKDNIGK